MYAYMVLLLDYNFQGIYGMKPPHMTPHPPPPPMPAPDYDTAAGSIYSVKGGGGGGRGIYDVSLYPPPGPPNQVTTCTLH